MTSIANKSHFKLDQSDYHEQEPAGNFVKPLSVKFYNNLLRLEERVQKKRFTLENINELIPLYAKCVEYYDSVKDPIKFYFLEKIQNTLANRETLKLLVKSKEDEDKDDNGGNLGQLEETEVFTPSEDETIFEDPPNDTSSQKKTNEFKKLRHQIQRYSMSKKKIERAKKITIFMELQEKKKAAKLKDIDAMMKNFTQRSIKNDKIIQENLNSQLRSIKERHEKRKILKICKSPNNTKKFYSPFYSSKNRFYEENEKAFPKKKFSIEDSHVSETNELEKSFLHFKEIIVSDCNMISDYGEEVLNIDDRKNTKKNRLSHSHSKSISAQNQYPEYEYDIGKRRSGDLSNIKMYTSPGTVNGKKKNMSPLQELDIKNM